MAKTRIEGYEQDCGLLRVQALSLSDAKQARVEAALGVAQRHLDRIAANVFPLTPAVAGEIEASILRAREELGTA